MDTIAFIIALGVGVVLIVWYAYNEATDEDGGVGLLAISVDGVTEPASDAGAGRYRLRERLAPARRAHIRAEAKSAYRMKAADKPSYRGDPDAIIEADKEY